MTASISLDMSRPTGRKSQSKVIASARLIVGVLILAVGVRTMLVEPFAIPSRSMEPTLHKGDLILVDKTAYGWSAASLPRLFATSNVGGARLADRPARHGDVVVFTSARGKDYVKRVIGRSGDRVALAGGTLVLNGLPIPCKAVGDGLCRETLPGGRTMLVRAGHAGPLADMAEIIVPEGQYFVLGDNRALSADSRLSVADGGVGLVPHTRLLGRVQRVALSSQGSGHFGIGWERIGMPIG